MAGKVAGGLADRADRKRIAVDICQPESDCRFVEGDDGHGKR